MNIISLSPNKYAKWLTYEDEYLIDSLNTTKDVSHMAWGDGREGFSYDLLFEDLVKIFYKGSIDAVLTSFPNFFDIKSHDLYESLKRYRVGKEIKIITKIPDPWRFMNKLEYFDKEYSPDFYLVPSSYYVNLINKKLGQDKAYMFPYFLGRRYENFGLKRKFDIALIGRCQNGNSKKLINPWQFRLSGLKVFHEKQLSKIRARVKEDQYLSRLHTTPLNLNNSLTSWNSPVYISGDQKHVPLRYIESAGCGTISISSESFMDLNDYYFSSDSYFDAKQNIKEAINFIKFIRKDSEHFIDLQSIAYKKVMSNHLAENRKLFILDLLNGNLSTDVRDFYSMAI